MYYYTQTFESVNVIPNVNKKRFLRGIIIESENKIDNFIRYDEERGDKQLFFKLSDDESYALGIAYLVYITNLEAIDKNTELKWTNDITLFFLNRAKEMGIVSENRLDIA